MQLHWTFLADDLLPLCRVGMQIDFIWAGFTEEFVFDRIIWPKKGPLLIGPMDFFITKVTVADDISCVSKSTDFLKLFNFFSDAFLLIIRIYQMTNAKKYIEFSFYAYLYYNIIFAPKYFFTRHGECKKKCGARFCKDFLRH